MNSLPEITPIETQLAPAPKARFDTMNLYAMRGIDEGCACIVSAHDTEEAYRIGRGHIGRVRDFQVLETGITSTTKAEVLWAILPD